jgi:hypothetical protein
MSYLPRIRLPAEAPIETHSAGPAVAALLPYKSTKWAVICGVILLAIGLILLAIGLALDPNQPFGFTGKKRDRSDPAPEGPAYLGLFGGIAVLGGGGTLSFVLLRLWWWRYRGYSGQMLWLCRQGIVMRHRSRWTVYRWHEARVDFPPMTRVEVQGQKQWVEPECEDTVLNGYWIYYLYVFDTTGALVEFSSLDFGWVTKTMGDRIQDEINTALLAHAYAEVKEGRTYSYAFLKISRAGLTSYGELATWAEVEGLKHSDDDLVVVLQGRRNWVLGGFLQLPQARIIVTLVEHLLTMRGELSRR